MPTGRFGTVKLLPLLISNGPDEPIAARGSSHINPVAGQICLGVGVPSDGGIGVLAAGAGALAIGVGEGGLGGGGGVDVAVGWLGVDGAGLVMLGSSGPPAIVNVMGTRSVFE